MIPKEQLSLTLDETIRLGEQITDWKDVSYAPEETRFVGRKGKLSMSVYRILISKPWKLMGRGDLTYEKRYRVIADMDKVKVSDYDMILEDDSQTELSEKGITSLYNLVEARIRFEQEKEQGEVVRLAVEQARELLK